MRTACFIYARLDSKRLPKKALIKIGEYHLIEYALNAAKNVHANEVVLLTSDRDVDDELEKIAYNNKVKCFRGDAFNVAKRTFDCLSNLGDIDFFARINGDSPFTQSSLIRDGFTFVKQNSNIDLYSNLIERSMPYGVSVEIISSKKFKEVFPSIVQDPYFSEHISSYFYRNSDDYLIKGVSSLKDNSHVSLTIDTPSDLERIRRQYERHNNLFDFSLEKVIEIFSREI